MSHAGDRSTQTVADNVRIVAVDDARSRDLSRRELLARGARISALPIVALPLVSALVACGGSNDGAPGSNTGSNIGSNTGALPSGTILAGRWIPTELGPGSQRLPVSIGTPAGLTQEGPSRLSARVVSLADDSVVIDGLVAERRSLGDGTIPFWTFRTTLTEPGFYALVVDGGPAEGAAFQVHDPSTLVVNRAGDRLEGFDTPTFDDARGVEVVCTRSPEPCPFHDLTLNQALATGRRVVYLVGTPAFCQTGVCAPVLDQMIDVANEVRDSAVFVHADVYTDRAATTPAPAVTAARLTFEPVLFVTDASGVIVERLDAIWDADEVRTLLVQ